MPTPSIINRSSMSGRFTPELVNTLVNRVKGASALAQLSQQTPIPFNGMKEYTFNMDNEVDLVAESGAKSRGGVSFTPVTIIPYKVEYGARMSQEFLMATEDEQIDFLEKFSEGFARKVAKGLDLMAFHGVNPRTGAEAALIGDNCFDKSVTNIVKVTSATTASPDAQVEAAIKLVMDEDEDVNGVAFSPAFRSGLAVMTDSDGRKVYPDLAWGSMPGSINGLPAQVSSNVSACPKVEDATITVEGDATKTTTDHALVGNFRDFFKWGYAKEIPLKIIEYGDPDNTGRDLQGYNEIYVRSEMYLGWGILIPKAFALIQREVVEAKQ